MVTGCGVRSVGQAPGRVTLQHERGETRARFAVFCAGAGSDRLAVAANASPDPRIVPFRGAYLYLRPERRELVRSLIYPVPDPSLPFLGVHLSRHIDGEVSLGAHRATGPTSRARLDLARNLANGAPLVAYRSDRAATRPQPARPGRRRRGIRSRHRHGVTSTAASPESAPRRWPATADWSTTSWSRRPSAPSTCATPPPPRRPPRSRWPG